jgi:hypothetical protein
MQARARQLAHLQAELLADVDEVVHCPPCPHDDDPTRRLNRVNQFAPFEVAVALTLTRRAADLLVGTAVELRRRLPAVWAALAAGDVDLPRARMLAEHVSVLPDPSARQVVEQVLPDAGRLTTGQLARRVDRLVLAVDPVAVAERRAAAVADRRVAAQPEPDGTATLTVLGLPVERVAAAMNRVETIAQTARRAGDPRTIHQLRADVTLGLLDGSLDPRGTGRGTVELVVPLATLAGTSDEPGEIPGWGPVLADVARQVATYQPDATWRYRVVDADGTLVAAGSTRRRPTIAQEAHVRARDKTCRAPGCRQPASRTELDHTTAYTDGGPTITANLGSLCTYHHRAKHEAGWRLTQPSPGVFVWLSPLGHRYVVKPDED